jgi:DNA polymerase-3 subunit epsilon
VSETLFDLSSESLPEWAKRIAVFDTETTGLDLAEARIVTACVAVLDENGELIAPARNWVADPGIEIPEVAARVHGYDTERARREGRPAAEVVGEIVEHLRELFAEGIAVVAYNAPYDFTILYHEAVRHQLQPIQEPFLVIDPLVLDKKLDWRKGKRKLENTAEYYQVPLTDAHTAEADAIAAGRVAQAIARKYSSKLQVDRDTLHKQQVAWSIEQDKSFAEFMRREVNPNFVETPGWPLKPVS